MEGGYYCVAYRVFCVENQVFYGIVPKSRAEDKVEGGDSPTVLIIYEGFGGFQRGAWFVSGLQLGHDVKAGGGRS